MKTADVTAISPEATDDRLVTAAKSGSPEAFAVLFRRYRPEIARYAGRILGDDGRAEDVVQEVFISALRGIGTLEQPAGFKPWLYRIAHNACIDQMRRRVKAEEVSFDAHGIPPADEIRLFRQPSSHAALTQKETFSNLRQALGDLPAGQAEILVLRELEGLSYDEIGARMHISRSAVESMLFRARRALRTEFGEISTGERCLRMRAVMAQTVEGVGKRTDRRRLMRHLDNCAGCRRDAFMMGLGPLLASERQGGVRAKLSRVAALFPLPGFLNRRSEETGRMSSDTGQLTSSAGTASTSFASHAHAAITQVSATAGASVEHAATAIQKAAAVVAAAAVVSGGGFVANGTKVEKPVPSPTAAKRVAGAPSPGSVPARPGAVFTSPMPLSLAPITAGPPAVILPAATALSATPAPVPEAAPPASAEPAPAPADEPPATESAAPPPEPETFDSSASTSAEPEPAAEEVVEPVVEAPVEPPPAEPLPPVDPVPSPPVDPGTPPVDGEGDGGASGGSGTIVPNPA